MPTWRDIDAFSVSMVLCIEKLHLGDYGHMVTSTFASVQEEVMNFTC